MPEVSKANKEPTSTFDLLEVSLDIVKRNWIAFSVVNIFTLLSAVFAFFPSYEQTKTEKYLAENPFTNLSGIEIGTILGLGITFVVVFIVINIFLYAMLTILEVESSKGSKPTLGHLFDKAKNYWIRLFGLSILMTLIILVGLLLLIVPGIIAIGRVIMAPYFMVDKNLGIMESLKASNKMGKNHVGGVWSAIGVLVLIGILGGFVSLVPIVGTLVGTLLVIAFSLVLPLRYLQLKKRKA